VGGIKEWCDCELKGEDENIKRLKEQAGRANKDRYRNYVWSSF
jgi:hypothetical protein